MRTLTHSIAAVALALAAAFPARADIAFYAGSGLPSVQGWLPVSIGNPGTGTIVEQTYVLDSTGAGVDTWGHGRFSPVPLDGTLGYSVQFSIRVPSETHSNPNRAGFSMMFIGNDPTQSVELGFRMNELFAYEYVGGEFVQGPSAAFGVSFTQHSYTLVVGGGQYTLRALGNDLISGPLQDYTGQGLPYTAANALFFGDNTSSGAAIAEVNFIDIMPVPEPAAGLSMLAGLGVLAWRLRQSRGTGRGLPSRSIAT